METNEWLKKHKNLLVSLGLLLDKKDGLNKRIRGTRKRLVGLDNELIKGQVEKC